MDPKTLESITIAQGNEITEHHIYRRLSRSSKSEKNRNVLEAISQGELGHYNFWKTFTHKEIAPNRWKIFKFYWISKLFGLTFGVKLMEQGEKNAQVSYTEIAKVIPEALTIAQDEERHEHDLIELIEEEKLKYVGSIVLGLNDALVELTGTLAGFTFALSANRLIALAGLITGISASFSMAASEYLSQKSENAANPLRASIYTGLAYIGTVFFLILPYFVLENCFISLAVTLLFAVFIIFIFNFYIAVARDLPFKKRFFEMVFISLSVAALSFAIGYLLKTFLHADG